MTDNRALNFTLPGGLVVASPDYPVDLRYSYPPYGGLMGFNLMPRDDGSEVVTLTREREVEMRLGFEVAAIGRMQVNRDRYRQLVAQAKLAAEDDLNTLLDADQSANPPPQMQAYRMPEVRRAMSRQEEVDHEREDELSRFSFEKEKNAETLAGRAKIRAKYEGRLEALLAADQTDNPPPLKYTTTPPPPTEAELQRRATDPEWQEQRRKSNKIYKQYFPIDWDD